MNTRLALSLCLLGACVTESDTETGTDLEHAQTVAGSATAAYIAQPLFDELGKSECGNGRLLTPSAQQIEVRWLATSCHGEGEGEIVFRIAGREVLNAAASGAHCTCVPGIRSERITDPETMKMIFGTVDLEVATTGSTLLAWAEVAVLDQHGEQVFTVFDQDGASPSEDAAANLCVAGSMEGGGGKVRVQFGEQCDDGNLTDGDGCNASCQFENELSTN